MNRVELAKGVYYVGAVDWNVRDFHGYTTPRGVTYNAYLIVDEKIALIDLVKAPFAGELLERISDIVDPAKIDYVVVNHVENDHAGALPEVMKHCPSAKVVISEKGRQEACRLYGSHYDFQVVKDKDTLSLGKHELEFIPITMLHWPDSMTTFLKTEGIYFSNDAFGQHICTAKRFDDEVYMPDVYYEAEKYFANILMPYARLIGRALQRVAGYDIKMIAPSHGVIWRSHICDIVTRYSDWGAGKQDERIVLFYETMWGGTERMAKAILEGIEKAGVEASFYRLSVSDRSHIMSEVLTAAGILVGSPTLNNGMMPAVGDMLTYLKGLRPAGKLAAAFGSFGWSGGAQKDIEEMLTKAGVALEPGLNLEWTPSAEEIDKAEAFGFAFAQKVKEKCAK